MKKPTVMIVDDDRSVRAALRVRLSALGYRVLERADRLRVLQECPKNTAGPISLDPEMPNGDGRLVAWMVRNGADVPVVFLSGRDREEFRAMVTQLPDHYVTEAPDGAGTSQLLASIIEPPRVTNAVA